MGTFPSPQKDAKHHDSDIAVFSVYPVSIPRFKTSLCPLLVYFKFSSSCMADVEKSTSTPRQRTFTGRPDDEESVINGRAPQGPPQDRSTLDSGSEKRPRRIADTEGLYRFWRRFNRHGKKNIGVRESLHAIVFSSCMCLSTCQQHYR